MAMAFVQELCDEKRSQGLRPRLRECSHPDHAHCGRETAVRARAGLNGTLSGYPGTTGPPAVSALAGARKIAPGTTSMTLLDAPSYNAARAGKRRRCILPPIVGAILIGIFVWVFWNWPAEHRVNRFFAALEQQQFEKAYGIWNDDPDWQQHPDKYKTAGY